VSGFWERVAYGEVDVAADMVGVDEFGVRFEHWLLARQE
jgi:hypothetical protein